MTIHFPLIQKGQVLRGNEVCQILVGILSLVKPLVSFKICSSEKTNSSRPPVIQDFIFSGVHMNLLALMTESLKTFELCFCQNIFGLDILKLIVSCKNLRVLSISGCYKMSRKCIWNIVHLGRNIEFLDITFTIPWKNYADLIQSIGNGNQSQLKHLKCDNFLPGKHSDNCKEMLKNHNWPINLLL